MTHVPALTRSDPAVPRRRTRRLVAAAGVVLCLGSAAACSSASGGTTPSSKAQPSSSSIAVTTPPASPSTSSTGGGSGLGFDGQAFQAAMAKLGVPANGPTSGTASTGVGTMSYSMVGSGTDISSITCRTSAMGGTPAQSDADAQILANPFLVGCATWSYQGALATQAATFVTSNLTTVQQGSPASTTIGPVNLQLSKDAAGQYSLTLEQ